MIVTCERCATQFQLDDSRVPKRGVRVRCSRCKNAFRVVPEAQRAAEEIAELSRRAREDSQEETTQDLAEDSRGNSRSRSGGRRGERRAEAPRSEASPAPQTSAAGGGLETEESDWKFNEDVAGGGDAAARAREETKPEPPAARRGQNADDWFSGGSDAPLELDDRPWDSAEAEKSPVESEPAPPPAAAPAPVSVSVAVATDLRSEPEGLPAASEAAELFDALAGSEPEPKSEPELVTQPAAAPLSADELSSDSWDQVFGEALKGEASEPEAAPQKKKKKRSGPRIALPSLSGAVARVGRWIGYGAQALGWVVTSGLFGAGLYAGLAAPAPTARAAEHVGGLEIAALEGHFIENAVSGRLFVVSGRVRNPGPGAGALQDLEIELLDGAGVSISGDRAPLRDPAPRALLRETPASVLAQQAPARFIAIRPGEERVFEAVFLKLPADAAAFRVAPSHGSRAASGPLPEVELPR